MENPVIPTLQETFDKVATHLLTQDEQSMDAGGGCQYRYHGLACAVGCLIPDQVYEKYAVDEEEGNGDNALENNSIEEANVKEALIASNAIEPDNEYYIDLLAALQRMHDTCHPNSWRNLLIDIALTRGLSAEVPIHFQT